MRIQGYEALVILKATGTEQELAQTTGQLDEAVKRLGGRIESSQSLGRRRLAFRISRQTEGVYHVVRFTAPTAQVDELKRLLRLNDAVLRFMVLNQDDQAVGTTATLGRPGAPALGRAAYGERFSERR